MAYQVLARKWRPQTFSEVVGQEHIARTLKNAIQANRIGHAYLFVGSRGIGKTTSARIFAKALNCLNLKDGEPCCECENCREIAAGNSLDVLEIDGASHNGVDDMRAIRDQVQYPPTKCRYKIYIIDEVHMLSAGAWNALLKTLEEPPSYVKFLFATTEPHKVLPTIISRCQRFDLRRIPVPLIAERLRKIADAEKIFVEDAALAAIARAADGGMRDAQSIFDQMIAFCGGDSAAETIRETDVINAFGLASGTELQALATSIFTNQLGGAMDVISRLAESGRDLSRVFEDLVEYVRNLMLAGTCNDAAKFLEVSREELADLVNLAHTVHPAMVRRVLAGFVAQERTFRDALNKRIALEVIVAQVMTDAHSVQLDDILTHLNVLSGLIPKEQLATVQSVAVPVQFTPPPVATAPMASSVACPEIIQPSVIPEAPETPMTEPPTPAVSVPDHPATLSAVPSPEVPQAPVVPPPAVVPEAPVVPVAPSASGSEAVSILMSGGTVAEATPSTPSVEAEPVKTGYRKATKEELSKMREIPGVQEIARRFNADVFDARIKEG